MTETTNHVLFLSNAKSPDGSLQRNFLSDLKQTFSLTTFVETGTYLGATTDVARSVFSEVHSIELSTELHEKARERFLGDSRVHLYQGDSATNLSQVVRNIEGASLLWLDAHYSEGITACGKTNTPILEELGTIVKNGHQNPVILIDDLRIFQKPTQAPPANSSLYNYPSLMEVYAAILDIAPDYQLFVYGDIVLAFRNTQGVDVSPVIRACTISRLFDGENLDLNDVLYSEQIIASASDNERETLENLPAQHQATEDYGLGTHYRLWSGMILAKQQRHAEASAAFLRCISLGMNHWRIYGYLAKSAIASGNTTLAQQASLHAVEATSTTKPVASNPPPTNDSPEVSPIRHDTQVSGTLAELYTAGLWKHGRPLRLHLGCGEQHFDGYINIDHTPGEHNVMQVQADFHADLKTLDFPAGSVDEIRLHHVFEHFDRTTALAQLIRWQMWLRDGGRLHIETPDLVGSARTLLSDAPMKVKMGVARHLAGDHADQWAFHLDHWFAERFETTLSRLGFTSIETKNWSWPHPPYLSNVEVIGIKTHTLDQTVLINVADELLEDSMVAPSESPMHDIWREQLRHAIAGEVTPSPSNIPQTNTNALPAQETNSTTRETAPTSAEPQGLMISGMLSTSVRKITKTTLHSSHVVSILFSKDRPLQLEATLRSFFLCCKDSENTTIRVLYTTSTESMESLYNHVAKEYPQVELVRESHFRNNLQALASGSDFILFMVDDALFVQSFSVSSLCHSLEHHPDALGFSLRLGTNIQHCYPVDQPQNHPDFEQAEPEVLRYNWPMAKHDFGYPLEVSSSLYRAHDILPLLEELSFSDPNTLEAQLAGASCRFIGQRDSILCAPRSLAFCIPVNKVQTVCHNRSGENPRYSIDNLADLYADGYRINVTRHLGFVPTACHQEIELSVDAPPLVSVIIPCYNQSAFLAETIESVALQNFDRWECIIIDDGSTDGTESVANTAIERHHDKPIRYIRQPNRGVCNARNTGISASRGKYILPLDADDKLRYDYLTETVAALEGNPDYSIVYVDEQNFGLKKHVHSKGTSSIEALKMGNVHDYCSLYRREVWERQGGYSPAMYLGGEDWNFWVGAAKLGFRSIHLAKPLFLYRNYERGTEAADRNNPNAVWSHLETQANLKIVWSHIVMHHPELYTAEQIHCAQALLAQVSQEQVQRMEYMLHNYPDNRLLKMFLDMTTSVSRGSEMAGFG